MWRASILGCGQISHYHYHALRQLNVDVVALADCDQNLLRNRASQWNIPQERIYTDFRELFTDESLQLDFTSCCLPPALHAEAAILAAKQGIHAAVEKPMAISLVECQKMVQAHRKQGTKLMVTEMRQVMPRCRIAKEAIDQGLIGEVVLLDWVANVPPGWASKKPWARQKTQAGGGLYMDWGVHAVDVFRTVSGEIQEVSAHVDTTYQDFDVEDRGVALLVFKNGVLGTMRVIPTHQSINKLSIFGTKGSIELDYTITEGTNSTGSPLRIYSQDRCYLSLPGASPLKPEDKEDWIVAYKDLYTDFLEAIRQNRKPEMSGEEGMADVAVVEAIYRSSDIGGSPVYPKFT